MIVRTNSVMVQHEIFGVSNTYLAASPAASPAAFLWIAELFPEYVGVALVVALVASDHVCWA